MKFFFPDSQDFVDPSFDMVTEQRSQQRVRQRDDLYPHEVFARPPYDGMLVSMAIVRGYGAGSGKYSLSQRSRFLRDGVRRFLRLPEEIETFGDCGAFSYWHEAEPPFGPSEAIDFYETCGFDYGLSVDHVIPVFRPDLDSVHGLPGIRSEAEKWKNRQKLTLRLAKDFLKKCRRQGVSFTPVGVAQAWSPLSMAHAVSELQAMGYSTIALGGLVPLKTSEILDTLRAVADIRSQDTKLHLLGVTRLEVIGQFERLGVTSFDSTAPLMRAFKDKKKNYFLEGRTFSAIRVPQLDGNPKLKKRVLAGEVDPEHARGLEKDVLTALGEFAEEKRPLEETLRLVLEYEALFDPKSDREADYRQVMTERPWERCDCDICRKLGIHVILFRGAERNRRRGFHNLQEFYRSLSHRVAQNPSHLSTQAILRAK